MVDPEESSIDSIVESKMAQYGNCAQASFSSLVEILDIEGDFQILLKSLYPFPGIGLTFHTCGAVSGSLCAIGLLYGTTDYSQPENSKKCMTLSKKLCSIVEQEFGSIECGGIMTRIFGKKFDLHDNEQTQAYFEANTDESNCTSVVKLAVKSTLKLIPEV